MSSVFLLTVQPGQNLQLVEVTTNRACPAGGSALCGGAPWYAYRALECRSNGSGGYAGRKGDSLVYGVVLALS